MRGGCKVDVSSEKNEDKILDERDVHLIKLVRDDIGKVLKKFHPHFRKRPLSYLLVLYCADQIDVFRLDGEILDGKRYFTIYKLANFASILGLNIEKTRAYDTFKKLESHGVVEIRKTEHPADTIYAITGEGRKKAYNVLLDLTTLRVTSDKLPEYFKLIEEKGFKMFGRKAKKMLEDYEKSRKQFIEFLTSKIEFEILELSS